MIKNGYPGATNAKQSYILEYIRKNGPIEEKYGTIVKMLFEYHLSLTYKNDSSYRTYGGIRVGSVLNFLTKRYINIVASDPGIIAKPNPFIIEEVLKLYKYIISNIDLDSSNISANFFPAFLSRVELLASSSSIDWSKFDVSYFSILLEFLTRESNTLNNVSEFYLLLKFLGVRGLMKFYNILSEHLWLRNYEVKN